MAAFVQGVGDAAVAASVSQAFAGNVSADSLIVVFGYQVSTSAGAFVAGDCTKIAGTAVIETLAQDEVMTQNLGGSVESTAAIWSARVTTGGSLTLQVAHTAANPGTSIHVMEFSGSWGATRLEDSASAGNAADGDTTADTPAMTSANGAVFVGGVGTFDTAPVAITEDPAWTLVDEAQASGAGVSDSGSQYRIVTTGTTDAASWTMGAGNNGWVAAGAVYFEVEQDLAATGAQSFAGSADLNATGSLAAAGAVTFASSADLDATGALSAAGAIAVASSADLDATGALRAAGALAFASSADLDALGELVAAGAIAFAGSADLGSGSDNDMAAAGFLAVAGAADLDAIGALAGSGAIAFAGTADLDATGALVAAGAMAIAGAADLDGVGALVAAGAFAFSGSPDLSALGALVGASTVSWIATALLSDANAVAQPKVVAVTLHRNVNIQVGTDRSVLTGHRSRLIED